MPRPKRKAKGTGGEVFPSPAPSGSTYSIPDSIRLTGAYGDALSRIARAEPKRRYRRDEGRKRNRYQRQATPVEVGTVSDRKPAPDSSVEAVTLAWVGHSDLQQVADSEYLQTALGCSESDWTVQVYSDSPDKYLPRLGKMRGMQWPDEGKDKS